MISMERITFGIQILILSICPLWLYLWLNKSMRRRLATNAGTHYTIPDWHFGLKRWWVTQRLNRRNAKKEKRREATDNVIMALMMLPEELESPKLLKDEDSSDSYTFYATDQRGDSLFLKVTRRRHRTVEMSLRLNLRDGRTYQLPNHPDTTLSDDERRGWNVAGLKISRLESWRRWRVSFNGLLRNGTRRNVDDDVGDLEHVRFGFIFIAASKPLFWPDDWSSGLQGDALAREPWKSPESLDARKLVNSAGYDQWGSMIGQLTFEDASTLELYLRGMRQRRWGTHEAAQLHRSVNFYGVTEYGTMYSVGAKSSRSGLTHMQFGHVREVDNTVRVIDWMDFNLYDFAEQRENIPTRRRIRFLAGGKKYTMAMNYVTGTGETFYGGRPWNWELRILDLDMQLNDDQGTGVGILWYIYDGQCPLEAIPHSRHLSVTAAHVDTRNYVISFQDKACQNEAIAGGKGASIALLTSIDGEEFTVPRGFCVTTAALDAQIEWSKELQGIIDELERVSTGKTKGELRSACQKAVSVIGKIAVVESVADAISRGVEELNSRESHSPIEPHRTKKFAVRSSAVGEDSEDTSAAGQNATVLGVEKTSDIIEAVAKCWASLFSHRSIEYRRQHGLPVKSSMAVCVQIMVDAEAAGVMFTRHPTTGDPRNIIITANYGLGETVVSAMVEPDTWIVHRDWNDALTIKDSILGSKNKKILMVTDGSTRVKNVDEAESREFCISREVALRLARLGLRLEAICGGARDVEWAIADREVFLLQVRPVTVLDAWTDFELTHELDSGVPNDTDIMTFANVGEVLPGVITPLSLSTVIRILNSTITSGSFKLSPTLYYDSYIWVVGMRCTLNYFNTMLRRVGKKISLNNKIVDTAVCGHIVLTPEVHHVAVRRNGLMSMWEQYEMLWNMLKDTWYNKEIEEKAKDNHESHELNADSFVSAKSLYDEINRKFRYMEAATAYHGHTSRVSVFCQVFAMTIMGEGNEDLTEEHYSDIALLLSSCSDVISAQVPTGLREIAHSIKASGKGDEFTTLDPSKAVDWLETNCSTAADALRDFLRVHGHRGIKEFDFATEPWCLRPENLIVAIQALVSAPNPALMAEELSPAETVSRLKTPKKPATRWILKKILPLCRTAVARRELTKALLISIGHRYRLAYRKLGRLMVEESRLPDDNLLFYLTHQEIGSLLKNRDPVLIRKAIRRRRLFPQLEKLQFAELNIGLPVPLEPKSKMVTREGSARISGTSVCNGSVLGRACIVTDLSEASQLQPGDVLITRCTDIGWSPYFPILGGVVTELGGIMSHGAVVAREYGLPCLVGADGATHMFRTGDMVLLVGSTGILQVVEQV